MASIADPATAVWASGLLELLSDERDRVATAELLRVSVIEPGQSLFRQGDDCKGVYWLLSGLVGLRRFDAQGNSALLRLQRAGDVLGYRALVEKCPYYNTAEAMTTCRVFFVPASRLEGLVERNPLLGQKFLKLALRDIADIESKCAALLTAGLKSRFLELIMMFYKNSSARSEDRGILIDLPLQRKDMAALLGATPESISRLINKLDGEGRVRFDGRRVVVPNLDCLIGEQAVH
jgi:CRP/FNR family transcriptional regulator